MARVTASLPSTRPRMIMPPAASTRARSSCRFALWSWERSTATPPRHSTARESPLQVHTRAGRRGGRGGGGKGEQAQASQPA